MNSTNKNNSNVVESENIIELKNITKQYEDLVVLDNLNLDIKKNEFLTLLGPSGCGKTTTLKIIAGFEHADEGEVMFEGENVNDTPPYERQVNTVFQKYALFPHMNVYENIAFGLKIKKMDKATIDVKVKEMLKLVALEGFEKRSIDSLSGGQQQRIAIARALVNEPKILLLDEPLGALDLKLRQEMQRELKKIQQKLGITFIFVTHDQEEALTMSDKIVVMNEGMIQQIGSPIDIYNEPENRFVANFIGESNIVEGHFIKDYLVEWHCQQFECVDKGFEEGQEVDIVLRPEDLDIVEPGRGKIAGEVVSVIFKGVHYEIMVRTENQDYKIHTTDLTEVGKKVDLDFWPEDIHVMEPMGTY